MGADDVAIQGASASTGITLPPYARDFNKEATVVKLLLKIVLAIPKLASPRTRSYGYPFGIISDPQL